MIVYHFAGEVECNTFEDVEKILQIRTKEFANGFTLPEEANTFTLCGENNFPFMIMMVKSDIASLYIVLEEGDAGYVSIDSLEEDKSGITIFYADNGEKVEVLNCYCLSFSKALSVCKEFFETMCLPKCIDWEKL